MTWNHLLHRHRLSILEYKGRYNVDYIMSDALRKSISEAVARRVKNKKPSRPTGFIPRTKETIRAELRRIGQ